MREAFWDESSGESVNIRVHRGEEERTSGERERRAATANDNRHLDLFSLKEKFATKSSAAVVRAL